jgi:hypothetical protein
MFRRTLLQSLISTPMAGWLRRWLSQAAFIGSAIPEPNAAHFYRQALCWADSLGPEGPQQLRQVATIAINDPQINALNKRARAALTALRRAASIEHCVWEFDIPTRDDLTTSRLSIANVQVIHAACLSARRYAESGRGREALDDLFAGLILAHRLGSGAVMMGRLLECGCEVPIFQTLGRILPRLDRPALEDLSRRLDVLPPPEPASSTITPESRFILGSLRAKLMARGPVLDGSDWHDLDLGEDEAAALSRLTGGDRARLLAHLDATGAAFTELARRLDLPRPDCRAALDEFARVERSAHPLPAMLVEHAWGVRHMVDRMRALRSMLRAGLVLVRDGEALFVAVRDPFGSGTFGLERLGNGYRIRSALADRDKPEVTLTIGGAA